MAENQLPQDKPAPAAAEPTVYASPATRAQLGGIFRHVADMAGPGGSDIILVSRADLEKLGTVALLDEFAATKRDGIVTMETAGGHMSTLLRDLGVPDYAMQRQDRDRVGLHEYTAKNLMVGASIMDAAYRGNVGAIQLHTYAGMDNGLPENGLCVVVVPDNEADYIGQMTHIPAALRRHGSPTAAIDQQWHMMAHEIGHCNTHVRRPGLIHEEGGELPDEVWADRHGNQFYKRLLAEGVVKTPLSEFFDARAIGAIHNPGHATAAAFDSGGTMIREALTAAEAAAPEHAGRTDRLTRAAVESYYDKIHLYLRDEAGLSSATRDEALTLLRDVPSLHYETVSLMNARGAFADNEIHQTMADQFLTAARRLAPDHFHVATGPDAGPPPEPESVTRPAMPGFGP